MRGRGEESEDGTGVEEEEGGAEDVGESFEEESEADGGVG